MRIAFSLLGASLVSGGAAAADLTLTFEVPRLEVAEYHRPYLAVWIAGADGATVADLAALYDVAMVNDEGETWLKDVRQWWRRSGRALDLPIDGVSGPTRAPGENVLTFDAADPRLAALSAGEYTLFIEASREVGGREMLSIPFTWPASDGVLGQAQGAAELGAVTLELTPGEGD